MQEWKGVPNMALTAGEKIKILMKRRGLTLGDLADKTNQSRQNLSNKMARDNFTEKEIKEFAEVLDCEYEPCFVMRDTGEKL